MTSREPRFHILVLSLLISVPAVAIIISIVHVPIVPLVLLIPIIFYVLVANFTLMDTSIARMIYILVCILKVGLTTYLAVAKPSFLSGVDWANFHRYATDAIAQSGNFVSLYQKSLDLYVFVVAVEYKLFGPYPVIMYFLSLLFSLIAFRFIYKSVRTISISKTEASVAALVYLLWPVNIVYTSSYLREAFVQMLVAWSFFCFIGYLKARNRKKFAAALGLGVIAAMVHSGLIVLPFVYAYIAAQGDVGKLKKVISVKSMIIALTLLGMILISPLGKGLINRLSTLDSADSINYQYAGQLDATTTYITAPVNSVGDFLLTGPYRFAMFTLSPLPWQIRNLETALSWILDGILQVVVVVTLYRVWRRKRGATPYIYNAIVTGMMCIVLVYAVFAMGTNNYGSAMRHRTKVLPITIIVIAAAQPFLKRKDKGENR